MSEKLSVENPTDSPVWVPGGELTPGQVAKRPDTEQLQELMKSGVLRDPTDYTSMRMDELSSKAEERGLEVKGTGADGAVLKADLEKALAAQDRKEQ